MRHFWIKKRLPILLAVLAILCAGAGAIFRAIQVQGVSTVSGQIRRLPIYSVETDKKQVALTFDAAWGNSDTDALIELMAGQNVKATFFVTGDWCDRCGEDVKKLSAAGHAIENHSDAHPHPNQLSKSELLADTRACSQKIEALTGIKPVLYRAPYGEYNSAVVAAIEDELGLKMIQWDADSKDWKRNGAEAAVQNAVSKVQNGSILLFHNDIDTTVEAVGKTITRLKAQGYAFVLVRDLICTGEYTMDAAGRQIPK